MFRIVFTLCIGKTMTCDSGFRIPGFRVALIWPEGGRSRMMIVNIEIIRYRYFPLLKI